MAIKIEIFGASCAKCSRLYNRVQKIVQDNGLDASVGKITDTDRIISLGIYTIPALVINDKVVSKGIAPNEIEILRLLNDFLPENEKLLIPFPKSRRKSNWLIVLVSVIIASVILSFVLNIKGHKTNQVSPPNLKMSLGNSNSINYLNNHTFLSSIYKITFLEFGSTGCRDCRKMEKVMEEVKLKYKGSVNVIFCNVRNKENKAVVKYFGIQMIPVQVLLDSNGKELYRHLGYYSFNELSDKFKKYGVF